jgi:hypothetical protein
MNNYLKAKKRTATFSYTVTVNPCFIKVFTLTVMKNDSCFIGGGRWWGLYINYKMFSLNRTIHTTQLSKEI